MRLAGARAHNSMPMSDYDIAIILEDVNHKFDVIVEGQQAMAHIPAAVAKLQEDMTEVRGDIRAIKAVAKDHSDLLSDHTRQLLGHGTRLSKLEPTA